MKILKYNIHGNLYNILICGIQLKLNCLSIVWRFDSDEMYSNYNYKFYDFWLFNSCHIINL